LNDIRHLEVQLTVSLTPGVFSHRCFTQQVMLLGRCNVSVLTNQEMHQIIRPKIKAFDDPDSPLDFSSLFCIWMLLKTMFLDLPSVNLPGKMEDDLLGRRKWPNLLEAWMVKAWNLCSCLFSWNGRTQELLLADSSIIRLCAFTSVVEARKDCSSSCPRQKFISHQRYSRSHRETHRRTTSLSGM
jgi:hypothetical protein